MPRDCPDCGCDISLRDGRAHRCRACEVTRRKAREARWHRENTAHVKKYKEAYYPVKNAARRANRAVALEYERLQRQLHPWKHREKKARRRAQQKHAMPAWADQQELKAIYKSAGEGQHVDHIIPVIHHAVCGLHVPWNLQVISASANYKKSNSFNPLDFE